MDNLHRSSTLGNTAVHVPTGLPPLDDRSLWVLGAVTSFGLRHTYLSRPDPDRMVPLYSGLLRSVVGRDYATVVRKLVTAGFLDCDSKYRPPRHGAPGKCRGYRLSLPWRTHPLIRVVLTKSELRSNLIRLKLAESVSVTNPLYLKLKSWVDTVTLSTSARYGEHVLLDRMLDGERYFSVDEQGRVHTPITTLPREYRSYVQVGNHSHFSSIDVRTCQPLLLSLVLSRYGVGSSDVTNPKPRNPPPPHPGIVARNHSFGLNDFRDSCLAGNLYDQLCRETGLPRIEQKGHFLAIVYGDPQYAYTRTGRALEGLFPGVLEHVAAHYDRKDRGRLARMMQNLESGVMIGGASKRFTDLLPDVPVLTLHDCLVVPTEHVHTAEAVIRESWHDRFQVLPSLVIQPF